MAEKKLKEALLYVEAAAGMDVAEREPVMKMIGSGGVLLRRQTTIERRANVCFRECLQVIVTAGDSTPSLHVSTSPRLGVSVSVSLSLCLCLCVSASFIFRAIAPC